MIEQLPTEWISIRQVWLHLINDVTQALVDYTYGEQKHRVYSLTILREAVEALRISLVDYGEATIRSDVYTWRKKYVDAHLDKDGKWYVDKDYYITLFSYILKTLNKYGMLFDTKPDGYTNVVMMDDYSDRMVTDDVSEDIERGDKENVSNSRKK